MTIKIIRMLQLTVYLAVTSQALFYLIVYSEALKSVSIEHFLEHRKSIEQLIAGRYKVIYLGCLVLCLVATGIAARNVSSLFFITSLIALILFVADLLIALKGSVPINEQINNSADLVGLNWEMLRTRWLDFFTYRGICSTLGMISLLIGIIFDKR